MSWLTDENLDYPDCMPPRATNSVKLSPKLEALMAANRRKRLPPGEQAIPSDEPAGES